jgi:hypothetical protein
MRAWPDKRHIAAQDIEELRHFVQRPLPQPVPYGCDPRVVAFSEPGSMDVNLRIVHRPELPDPKDATVQAHPGLAKQDGSGTIQLDEYGNRYYCRCEEYQDGYCKDPVKD